MPRRRILWQLYPTYLLIFFITLIGIFWFGSDTVKDFWLEQVNSDLSARANLVGNLIVAVGGVNNKTLIDSLCKDLGQSAGARITVILPGGEVIGDSEENPSRMENHAQRPEIMEALSGVKGTATRYSGTTHHRMMYVALPFYINGQLAGAIRTSRSIHAIDDALGVIRLKMALIGIAFALIMAGLSLYISRKISRPLELLKIGAEKFSRGDFSGRLPASNSEEINALASSMNVMAARLDEQIRALFRQRNEQEAILASMLEGVIAIDAQEKIISVNRAAADMLEIDINNARGKMIYEVVRIPDIHKLASNIFMTRRSAEEEIAIAREKPLFLQARGALLKGSRDEHIGVLIVLNDVTRLKELEAVRKDFVANVSHELKTPITGIKGFVETILDGALDHPDEAKKFLKIIQKQADRLNAIIDDLLMLSKIENDAEGAKIRFEEYSICDVLQNSLQICQSRAAEKKIEIFLECEPTLKARINPLLLEQAVVNLIDNAVKYSSPESRVTVAASRKQSGVEIAVVDNGCGIARERHSRIFERFYRVDSSRNRELGGAGLGLAIVKHIALAHGGAVDVQSSPGEGSVFTIKLPTINRNE
jgi:two-component system phosphate regulon sensor histidine kinase PhoR